MNAHETRAARIERLLRAALAPLELEISDVTHKHARHRERHGIEGKETHFSVRIVSHQFEGLSLIACHRTVNEVLKTEFESGLHSLSLSTQIPAA